MSHRSPQLGQRNRWTFLHVNSWMLGAKILVWANVVAAEPLSGFEKTHDSIERIAVERATKWVAAFNTQDAEAYGRFLEEHGPAILKYARDDARYAALLDGVAVRGSITAEGSHAKAVLAPPFIDGEIALDLKISPDPPYAIVTADLSPPNEAGVAIVPFETEAELIHAVNRRVTEQASRQRFSGVIHIENRDGVVLSIAAGNVPSLSAGCAPADVALNGASVPKMLVSASVLKLVDSGRVTLDDRIDQHLPDLGGRPLGAATVRELLDHSAGAGDFPKTAGPNRFTHQQLFDAGLQREPTHQLGKQWKYANYGYVLLGELLRRKTHQDGAAAARAWLESISPSCNSAVPGLTRDEAFDPWTDVTDGSVYATPTSAGGLRITARQIAGFFAQLKGGQVLSEQLLAAAWKGRWQMPDGRYALGFREYERAGLRYVGHGGAAPGVNNQIAYFPQSGWLIVVLGNTDPPYGSWVSEYIVNRMGHLARLDSLDPKRTGDH